MSALATVESGPAVVEIRGCLSCPYWRGDTFYSRNTADGYCKLAGTRGAISDPCHRGERPVTSHTDRGVLKGCPLLSGPVVIALAKDTAR